MREIHTANMHCEEPCGIPAASGRLCKPSSAYTSQSIVKREQKTHYKPKPSSPPQFLFSLFRASPPHHIHHPPQDKLRWEGRVALKRSEKASSLRFKATSQSCKEPFIHQGNLPLLQAGLSWNPGAQFSEGCHWFVTGDKWGQNGSHNPLQRGRFSHNAQWGETI